MNENIIQVISQTDKGLHDGLRILLATQVRVAQITLISLLRM